MAQVAARNSQNAQVAATQAADEAKRLADEALVGAAEAEADAARAEQELSSLIAARRAATRVAEEEREATEARYRELREESERIAAQIRAMARGGGTAFSDARLLMPVRGWKTSDFGNRFDPFYRRWQLHAGVDIGAAGGSPIRAAAAGRVFRAGWNGGYGNYTCLYHGTYRGDGFATCYAHQSRIVVGVGDRVSRGEVIGLVGTTGCFDRLSPAF